MAPVHMPPGSRPGTLYLVPAPLDFGCSHDGEPVQVPLAEVMPAHTLATAARLTHWVCENAKSTRAYLKRVFAHQAQSTLISALQIQELPRAAHKHGDHRPGHATEGDARALLAPALAQNGGHDIGLVSEAGMPAVADPGASVVRAAHDLGLPVVPLVGPSSILLALAASGLNGQDFAFVGYLPQEAAERTARLQALESLALKTGQTQLFIETPYRNAALLQAALHALHGHTRLAVCSALTLPQAQVHSRSVQAWRQQVAAGWAMAGKQPVLFALGR